MLPSWVGPRRLQSAKSDALAKPRKMNNALNNALNNAPYTTNHQHDTSPMTIAWHLFTPLNALAGGLLIGAAASLYMLGRGRIAGISGIVAGPLQALFEKRSLTPEMTRLLFIVGLLAAPGVWRLVAPLPASQIDSSSVGLVMAGLLVGVGTRMGGGCTSGHGVCGLSRFSMRSLVNVCTFMAAGVVTTFVLRQVL
jgi:uncharacterized protein